MKKSRFKISGMTCAACASGLERILKKQNLVKDVKVNFATEMMDIEYEEELTFEKINSVVNSLGFNIVVDEKPKKKSNISLVISTIVTVILLYIAMGYMITDKLIYPNIIDPIDNPINFCLIQLMLSIVVIILNIKIYKVGYRLLFKLSPNMDSLVAIGTTASFIYSIYSLYMVYNGNHSFVHNLYFESTATILTLIQIGKYFEEKSKTRTKASITKLLNLSPKMGTVVRDGIEVSVQVSQIKKGDIVVVKTGEKIPVDGVIIEGSATIDESIITGESMPVEKSKGEKVIGATIISDGYIKVETTDIGENTVISHIIKMVEDAQNSKAPVAKLADKVSGYFTFGVLSIAIISFAIWYITGHSFSFSINIFVSILVIACPCALGLATPIAIMVATGKGASLGILYKDAKSVELLSKTNTVVFDKTGTLTNGKLVVENVYNIGIDLNELISYTYALEKLSSHLVANAIVEYSKKFNIEEKNVEDVKIIQGKGMLGLVDGSRVVVGNISLIKDYISEEKINSNEYVKSYFDKGKTLIYVAIKDNIVGIFNISDTIKENSKILVEKLNKNKIATYMITGDRKNVAYDIANECGINIKNVFYETLPEDKLKHIESLKNKTGVVVMVGDGINDSPALASADIGIAIGNGTDIAIETADVVLIKSDVFDVFTAIYLGKRTMRIIKQNLFWAFFYNCIGIFIAMGIPYIFGAGLLNPMIAALAMSFSSVCVITNSLRINSFKVK